MQSHRGFTLIEVLLVVLLVAITAVAVISTLPTNKKDFAKKSAQLLYQRLQLLNEEAILNGQDYGIRVNETKSRYTIMTLGEKGWQVKKLENMSAQTQLPSDLSLHFELGGGVWKDNDRLFKPGSLFDDSKFDDSDDKEKKQEPPQIFILSSGEVTPFSLTLYPANSSISENGWTVLTKANGQILLRQPGETDEK
ncbi:type II secretion system minor pseudopilin GspH [Vibrio sp. S4M6]|uniref:type II secretion system minor pseudopilin GspH n=1 Tax=Vibrio sinus TaxID=2946865 RepID=UPI002029FF6B|nr:type II secretion system minor pseudopilin GspH [Vibrio sinus]MCL9780314.1 type II secretion system minor pseudopilin GspH [Vibrio sinus]